jgi:DNA-binding NtrC family response regulator
LHRVLVVDDDLPVARALQRWLTRLGVHVILLVKGDDFERVLMRERPTLVVCDYLMPQFDGVALLTLAKRFDPAIRRCLLSGSLGLVSDVQRATIAPCLFLEKPWDLARLAAQLGLTT